MAKQPRKGKKDPAEPLILENAAAPSDESTKVFTDPYLDIIPPEVHGNQAAQPETAEPVMAEAEVAETETIVVAEKSEPEPATAPEPEKAAASAQPAPQPAPAPVPEPEKRGGFFPLLLGGLIAGGIGFGAAYYWQPQPSNDLSAQIDSQGTTISALRQEIEGLPTVDLSGLETAQADLATSVQDLQTRLDGELAAIDERFRQLAEQPTDEGATAGPAISAYETELEELRAQIAEMADGAQAQLEEARNEAASIEENAAAAARAAAGRAAIARVQAAMESGAAMGPALTDLEAAMSEPVPEALLAVQDGIPTLSSLQEKFPDVARAALATAREERVAGEETTGLGAFLRNQLDVRSVAPREGNTVDAILSRAEAALQQGRLSDTLAEVNALPDVVRAEMSDWLGEAETRANAVASVDDLLTSLNDS